jgi:glycosyltransferase involved in cell wall biosynthesis
MFDVVMPLYNKEEFVGATINAVLAQTFADWRLIIVDDGSTDGSAELVRSYGDPRINLIQQKNQGVGPARNAGIRSGTAEWIAFLDADDVWNGDHLAELDELRMIYPEAGLVGCAFRRFSGAIDPEQNTGGSSERRLTRYFAECAAGRELLVTSSAAVRRTVIDAVGAFQDLPGNEDVELWARLALHGPVAVSSKPTVNYRVDSGGITDKGMGRRKPEPKPTRREDLSSTIPTLERALPAITDAHLRGDIISYMDSRIGIRMTAAVLEGDVDYARQLLALYTGKPTGKAGVAAKIASLPRPVAKAAMALRSAIKQLSRR